MKNIHHILPCGAIYKFKQYGYADMAEKMLPYIFNSLTKEQLNSICKGDNYGRKLRPWGVAVYSKVMNTVWDHVVEHLLESDRILIPHKKATTVMYIGQTPDNPKRMAKKYKRVRPYFATNGNRYTILLDGVKHSYYFRMTQNNRRRLYNKIKAGGNYH